jgi:predicted Zn-dependent protease
MRPKDIDILLQLRKLTYHVEGWRACNVLKQAVAIDPSKPKLYIELAKLLLKTDMSHKTPNELKEIRELLTKALELG